MATYLEIVGSTDHKCGQYVVADIMRINWDAKTVDYVLIDVIKVVADMEVFVMIWQRSSYPCFIMSVLNCEKYIARENDWNVEERLKEIGTTLKHWNSKRGIKGTC